MNNYFFFLILVPAILAYSTTKRKVFLVANSITIIIIIFAFLEKNNISGVFIEIMMFAIHLAALTFPPNIENRLRKIAPPVAFAMVLFINEHMYDYFMATAILFFTIAVYQEDMKRNKMFMIIGMVCMLAFSFKVGAIPVVMINILGLAFLSVSYLKIEKIKVAANIE